MTIREYAPWPDGIHIRTWRVLPGRTPDVQIWELPTSSLSKVIVWQTYRQTSYAWSLPVTWQRWWSHHSIHGSRKPHATCNLMALSVIKAELLLNWILHCGNRHIGRFRLLWPWSWPDDLHMQTWPVMPEDIPNVHIYIYEVPPSRLSIVIVW